MKFKELSSPFSESRIWGCVYKGISFVIYLEEKMGEGFEKWAGYSASYKKDREIIPINGIVSTFTEAVELCKKKLSDILKV